MYIEFLYCTDIVLNLYRTFILNYRKLLIKERSWGKDKMGQINGHIKIKLKWMQYIKVNMIYPICAGINSV
jgi:hypothetical protein